MCVCVRLTPIRLADGAFCVCSFKTPHPGCRPFAFVPMSLSLLAAGAFLYGCLDRLATAAGQFVFVLLELHAVLLCGPVIWVRLIIVTRIHTYSCVRL